MATIQITIPDAQLTRVVNGLCAAAGVTATPANAKQAVIDHVKATVLNAEQQAAIVALQTTPPVDPGLS
jgi:hypothetical protein